MKILIVVTGSIAAVKCEEIIKNLQLNNFKVSCLFTANSLKIINFSKIKKLVFGKVYLDRSEINNKIAELRKILIRLFSHKMFFVLIWIEILQVLSYKQRLPDILLDRLWSALPCVLNFYP